MALLNRLIKNKDLNQNGYPFSIPSIAKLDSLNLDSDVIILEGDNGSGKSTILEILASKLKLVRIGIDTHYEATEFKALVNALDAFKLHYLVRPKGFLFRSEDFITYLHYIEKTINEACLEIARIDEEYGNSESRSSAKALAKMPHFRTIQELKEMFPFDLQKLSHGESYLAFFESRIRKKCLYLLDEAEMPLSFQNQLTLLAYIKEAVKDGCQFIISTHSPILMSYPNALIYQVDDRGVNQINYSEVETVQLWRSFLNNKDKMLDIIFGEKR